MPSSIEKLAEATSSSWPNIRKTRELAASKREELKQALSGKGSRDTSIVVFGSLAREEFTEGSDVDWTLLVDGIADPVHLDISLAISRTLSHLGCKGPGREGTFGNLTFSHDVIHLIGGPDDSNANTTRRILLLLESEPLGEREAYDRVLTNILNRYLDDRGIWHSSSAYRVPRFLLTISHGIGERWLSTLRTSNG